VVPQQQAVFIYLFIYLLFLYLAYFLSLQATFFWGVSSIPRSSPAASPFNSIFFQPSALAPSLLYS
jgi:hypothetical protein